MSVNDPHKFLQYEMPPPPGAWDNIARRLDAEYDIRETRTAEKLFDATLTPPASAWQSIEGILDNQLPEKQPARVIPFFTKTRLTAAAVILGVLLTGTWLFLRPGKVSTEIAKVAEQAGTVVSPNASTSEFSVAPDINTAIAQIVPRRIRVRDMIRSRAKVPAAAFVQEQVIDRDPTFIIPEPRTLAINNPRLIDATQDASVAAPLLRDVNGKIIRDMNLLTSAGSGNYVTVTGPNGEQTRISSKFVYFLPYLNNAANESDDTGSFPFWNSASWKSRFEEWRSKILEQAAFSPSSATFFDILELKELIKD